MSFVKDAVHISNVEDEFRNKLVAAAAADELQALRDLMSASLPPEAWEELGVDPQQAPGKPGELSFRAVVQVDGLSITLDFSAHEWHGRKAAFVNGDLFQSTWRRPGQVDAEVDKNVLVFGYAIRQSVESKRKLIQERKKDAARKARSIADRYGEVTPRRVTEAKHAIAAAGDALSPEERQTLRDALAEKLNTWRFSQAKRRLLRTQALEDASWLHGVAKQYVDEYSARSQEALQWAKENRIEATTSYWMVRYVPSGMAPIDLLNDGVCFEDVVQTLVTPDYAVSLVPLLCLSRGGRTKRVVVNSILDSTELTDVEAKEYMRRFFVKRPLSNLPMGGDEAIVYVPHDSDFEPTPPPQDMPSFAQFAQGIFATEGRRPLSFGFVDGGYDLAFGISVCSTPEAVMEYLKRYNASQPEFESRIKWPDEYV